MIKRYLLLTITLLIITVGITACGRGIGSFDGVDPIDPASIAGEETELVESNDGKMSGYMTLVENLRAVGAAVETRGEIRQPFFSIAGQRIEVNGEDVQVFEYVDVATAEVEALTVAPDGSYVSTTMLTWIATPHFFKADSLIVIYVGDDARVIKALEDLLRPQFAGG